MEIGIMELNLEEIELLEIKHSEIDLMYIGLGELDPWRFAHGDRPFGAQP